MENREVWLALEDACGAGKVKSIGVSNFLSDDLDNILAECRIKPAVNQILLHIGDSDLEILKAVTPIQNYGEYRVFPVFSGK